MKTAALHALLGCANNTLNRLVTRGVLRPSGVYGHGGAYDWDDAEQRAAIAVVRFMRSHLMEPGHSKAATATEARDDCLRSIAAATREPSPDAQAPAWLILRADGSCVRGDDWLAATMVEHRTLIPLTANGV